MRRILLDTRELAHPEPLERAIKALRQIDNDCYLYMLNRKNPIPLIRLAEQHKFQIFIHEASENEWHILISKNRELLLKKYLDV